MDTLLRRRIIFPRDSRFQLIAAFPKIIPYFQEHEDILSQASQDDGPEELNDTNDGPEELNEDLLDDEEEEDDEKSWKRRNNEDD